MPPSPAQDPAAAPPPPASEEGGTEPAAPEEGGTEPAAPPPAPTEPAPSNSTGGMSEFLGSGIKGGLRNQWLSIQTSLCDFLRIFHEAEVYEIEFFRCDLLLYRST